MNQRLKKGELDFIKGCTKAILKNKTDHHHWLFDVNSSINSFLEVCSNYCQQRFKFP
jgi:hypothetical protein